MQIGPLQQLEPPAQVSYGKINKLLQDGTKNDTGTAEQPALATNSLRYKDTK